LRRYPARATPLPVFLAAVVDFVTTLVLGRLLSPFCLLRGRLALRRCFLAARRGCRLLTLSDCLRRVLARLLASSCFRRGPLTLRPCFLAARRGCWLLTLKRCLLWVLHGRPFHLRRGKGQW
jgi:hypothetical protein